MMEFKLYLHGTLVRLTADEPKVSGGGNRHTGIVIVNTTDCWILNPPIVFGEEIH